MRHNKKKKTGRTALIVLLALVLLFGISAVGSYFLFKNYDKPFDAASTKTVDFVVPSGASTIKIASLLEQEGLIKDDLIFRLKSKLNGLDGKFQAGEYELSPSMGMNEIMEKLQDGKRETQKITIKEGWSLVDIATYLDSNGIVTKEEFYNSLEQDEFDQWFVKELKETAPDPTGVLTAKGNRFEGFLFPDTYEIYVGSSARSIINKMLNQFDKKFDDELKAKLEGSKYSLQEVIAIASIIEGETVIDKERALVSSVIYNRLESNVTGKKLQMCSTVLYSIGYHKSRVLFSDLEVDSPYNTYKYAGLPAGPINNPGIACIKAALNPADTNYYYFVVNSKGDGSHKFSNSYYDHAKNATEYQRTLD